MLNSFQHPSTRRKPAMKEIPDRVRDDVRASRLSPVDSARPAQCPPPRVMWRVMLNLFQHPSTRRKPAMEEIPGRVAKSLL